MNKTLYIETKYERYVTPVHADDMPIFMHCTGGMSSIATYIDKFKQYAPVFYAHGYVKIILDDVEIGSAPPITKEDDEP